MGPRGRPGSGVEPLRETIRLRFTWGGQRRYETLPLKPTAQNIRAAERLLSAIRAEIMAGVFVYVRHFPDSPAALQPTTLSTFKDYADRWLETLTTEYGTAKGYRTAITKVWSPVLGGKALQQIRHSDIKAVIASRHGSVSAKTLNNDMIPLRAVLDTAVLDGLLAASPARMIKNLKHQAPTPDPFTAVEMEAILTQLQAAAPEQVWAYYEFAFMTGIRPSEQIIARWGKVDQGALCLRVDTALTRGREKGTKTHSIRDIDLTPRALAALARMKTHTFMRGLDAPIFCHPATGRPWTNDQYQRITFFHPVLKKLGIRKRDAYQTRHTFATLALMGGVTPAYIARQMGHANAGMLFRVYAKWIDGADKGRETAKMATLQSPTLATHWPRPGDAH